MRSAERFSGELEFLNDFAFAPASAYRHSRFLESEFDAPVWTMRTGKAALSPIDFRVRLDDGRLLTDPKHHDLLEIFKCWICVHDHPDVCGGRLNSGVTARHKIQRTLHVIDYMLLNSHHFQLAPHGLMAMSANDVRGMLLQLGTGNRIHETLYGWSERLASKLREEGAKLKARRVTELLTSVPELATPCESDLGLDSQELVRARAWLWTRGYYRRAPTATAHVWMPDMMRLCDDLYANTLYGRQRKPPVRELLLEEGDIGYREFPRAPVNARDEDDFPTKNHISAYMAVIRPLELLALTKLRVPEHVLHTLSEPLVEHLYRTKRPGRYRTLPQEAVLGSLRNSVEFVISHGDTVVDGYLTVLSEWKGSGLSFQEFARAEDFGRVLSLELRDLGVERWCVRPLPDGYRSSMKHIPPGAFFTQFRANLGLYELLQVLYGAALLVLGVLSARRSGELEDLPCDCLDKSRTRLVFLNRKSSEVDLREREVRPIPRIAVRAIGMLQRLAAAVRAMGLSEGQSALFCAPSRMTGLPSSMGCSSSTERLLDMLCDYIETPLVS